ncbi:hypothetical protein [Chitinophaga arvensicola]|uniref:Replication initiation factor n=1 Tax=Chitinophaga arvensicola TaxID=29529 RepID=A0A1I0S625_9BACT|nr:hypothetical protein [Chitinophaga arvensicola]SEW50630.1 hypothetical protein SAMN04488122_3899 [Chitinophaga arvensicola]
MNYVHAIDWLQIHVKCPVAIQAKDNFTYHTEKTDYQTRQFREVYEISVLMPSGAYERCAVLACKPHAAFLGGDMGLLKIENKFLYQSDLKQFVVALLEQYHFKFHSISRLDLALDFTSFNGGLPPEDLIKNFLQEKWLKKHKAKFTVVGDHMERNAYEYLRFGAKTSEINYYMYNKSKELDFNKDKPWIRAMWEQAGFHPDAQVWRLEFSMKSSCKELVDYDFGEVIPVKALAIIDGDNSFTLFRTLFYKHFTFVRNTNGNRKDRMNEVDLLTLEKPNTVVLRLTEKMESTRMDKVVIKRMEAHNQYVRTIDKNYYLYGAKILMEYLIQRNLIEWYLQHFPGGSAELSVLGRKAGLITDEYLQQGLYE